MIRLSVEMAIATVFQTIDSSLQECKLFCSSVVQGLFLVGSVACSMLNVSMASV